MKRLFVAIDLPEAIAAALAEAARENLRGFGDARLTPKGNLHVTVHFLGNTSESSVAVLGDALAEACATVPAFTLSFAALEFAPPQRPPTMFWARFEDGGSFGGLSATVAAACRPFAQAAPPAHAPVPHVTLARLARPLDARNAAAASVRPPSVEPLIVRSCVLYESRLASGGPTYAPLAEYPLNTTVL